MKLIITLAALLLLNFCAFAQTDPIRTELNTIFQNIDKSHIPTGYLNEYALVLHFFYFKVKENSPIS